MSDPAGYTVGWICALPVEYIAAQEFLDEEHDKPIFVSPNDANDYTLGKMGEHNLVIAVLPDGEYGTASAASVATNMLNSFHNIRVGLMVGIGGGVPSESHDIRLGDVVVSAPRGGESGVFQYDFGKSIQDQSFQHTRFLNQPPAILRAAMAGIRTQYERKGHQLEEAINGIFGKNMRLRRKYKRPEPITDRLFLPEVIHHQAGCDICAVDPSTLVLRSERADDEDNPAIHYGLIASGNQLMKDALIRDRLVAEKDVLCFEMEAAGLMNTFPCLVIRGICDYSDSHKNKEWQGYAAMVAAAYAKDLLQRISLNRIEAEERISAVVSEELKGIQHRLDQAYSQHERHFSEQKARVFTDQQRRCYQVFKIVNYAEQKDINPKRAKGTCRWAFQSSEYIRWWESNCNNLLWVSADPGCGKSGEEQNDQIHEEIDQVARIRVRELAETVPLSPELHHRLEQQLLQMEHRTYLWLHLAIDDIRTTFKDSLRPAEDWITLIPPSVNAAYENILCRVPAGLIDRVKKILEIIVAARRPLTIKEMAMALGIATSSASPTTKQDGLDPIGLDGKLRRWCGLFVFTNNSKIYLIHQTAREYLIEKKNFSNLKSAYWSSLTDAEDQMAEICLTYLLMENLEYDEDDSGSHARSFLEYSAAHWPDHVRKMSLTSTQKETYRVHRLYDISGKPFLMWYPIFWKAIRPYERTPVMSALHLAAFNGHEQEVHSILGVDESDVNTADDTTTYPVMWASLNGHDRIVELLLERGADANAQGGRYGNALQAACYEGHDKIAQILLEREADFNTQGGFYGNALQAACFRGHDKIAQILLERGADANAEGGEYGNALQAACSEGRDNIARILLEKGANINAEGGEYGNALQAACFKGRDKIARILLEQGANVNAEGGFFGNALQAACFEGRDKIARILLEKGANVNAEGRFFGNALQAACFEGRDKIATNGKLEIVRLLLDNGADISVADNNGCTPLYSASSNGHLGVVRLLLDNGADIILADKRACTPLHGASENGHVEVVKLLLQSLEASIDTRDDTGRTPLFLAAARGRSEVLRLLLSCNALANVNDRYNATPLCAAIRNGHREAVELLLPLTESTVVFEDGLGRTLAWWASKSGCVKIIDLVHQLAQRMDIETRSIDLLDRAMCALAFSHLIALTTIAKRAMMILMCAWNVMSAIFIVLMLLMIGFFVILTARPDCQSFEE
ncbi:hypothetical protein NUH16_003480 [Penicillium rubens]|nr:hypothetical protein NUH16_003480 [Penicillium rubens]